MRRATLVILFSIASFLRSGGVSSQLPAVQVPSLPGVRQVLPETTRAVGGGLRALSGARALRADRLFNEHRAELDRDNRGELVVRAEVVAIDITQSALDQAVAARFSILRTEELADLGVRITLLQTPEGMDATRGLKRLRKLDPEGSYDYNHVYLDSGEVGEPRVIAPTVVDAAGSGSSPSGRVGLIDGGVDGSHQALRNLQVHRFGCHGAQVPSAHGTAVASILAGRQTIKDIYAADVYCGEPAGGAVDAVAAALGWMAREKVAVINVSLVGPRNTLLERAVNALVARGHIIVAAVGNDGPAAPPLFPAAFEGVVGVTGVDSRHRVLAEACRGKQVDFSALGAEVFAAAGAPDKYAPVRGTSFAAPLVAALLAEIPSPDIGRREQLLGRLLAAAQDLGKPGRDDTYGAGELAGTYK